MRETERKKIEIGKEREKNKTMRKREKENRKE